jgi:hypothetical protein
MIDYTEAVAYDVRSWAEQQAARGHVYGRRNLCGWCARASAELYLRLRRAGIAGELHAYTGSVSHVFLETHGPVVAVTATQFGEFWDRPVVILDRAAADAYSFYSSTYRFSSVRELRDWQSQMNWPACERARPRMSRGNQHVRCL